MALCWPGSVGVGFSRRGRLPSRFRTPDSGSARRLKPTPTESDSHQKRRVHMSRISKVGLLLTAVLLLVATSSAGQESKPTFSPKDRALIETYYTHLLGTLAPGSVDRSPF